jgi:hypothetical protein
MKELKSLNSVQQSVACALALQMVSGDEINITDAAREQTAADPLTSQKVASLLDSTSNMLSALGSLGGSGSSNPLSKLADGVLGTASKVLSDDKILCRGFIQRQLGTEPSDLHFLGVSNPLLRDEEEDADDEEAREASLTDVFPTGSSRAALLAILRKFAELDPGFEETPSTTIGKVVAAFG